MVYLITQIALFLLLAVLMGLFIGWWFWARGEQPVAESSNDIEVIESKRRLDQCHRENAKLRREGKQYKDDLDRLNARIAMDDDGDLAAKLDVANAKIQALMEDVQMREDTIAVLEKEIEKNTS